MCMFWQVSVKNPQGILKAYFCTFANRERSCSPGKVFDNFRDTMHGSENICHVFGRFEQKEWLHETRAATHFPSSQCKCGHKSISVIKYNRRYSILRWDMAHRGHTLLYGIGIVIDVATNLVIDFEVLSKYCPECIWLGSIWVIIALNLIFGNRVMQKIGRNFFVVLQQAWKWT